MPEVTTEHCQSPKYTTTFRYAGRNTTLLTIAGWIITTLMNVGDYDQVRTINSNIVCFRCNRPGHKILQCPMNLNRMAAVYQINDQEAAISNYSYRESHNCDESQGDGEVELACGCVLPVVAGAMSPDGQPKLKHWQTQMVPCSRGRINGTRSH